MSENGKNKRGDREFTELRAEIDAKYTLGRFVAIEAGSVIVDAESHRELVQQLRSIGKSPKDLLVLQAGVSYPESAVILLKEHA